MTHHYNYHQPDGDPYNLGQWIESVPHAYDPTLQPEIDLTGDLSLFSTGKPDNKQQ